MPKRTPLTLAHSARGEGPVEGGFTRDEWDALWRGSIEASRACQERAAAAAVRLGVEGGGATVYQFGVLDPIIVVPRRITIEGNDA